MSVKYTKQLLVAALLMTPLLATAQLGRRVAIAGQVPFEFVVGDRLVPAGKCVVQPAPTAADTILIRNDDATVRLFSSMSLGEARHIPATDELVFHKYGDRYFLSEIRVEGSRVVYQLPESKEEAAFRLRNQPSAEETIHAF
jgi:hypothetical protein